MFIDTHCHIHFDQFDEDREKVIQRAIQNKVNMVLNIGTDLETSKKAIELAEKFAIVFAAVGVHPNDGDSMDDTVLNQIEEFTHHDKVKAIGEIGLDYYWMQVPQKKQIEIFRQQIKLAKKCHLPIIVHNRDAHEDVLKVLKEEKAGSLGVVLHSFTGDTEYLTSAIKENYYISFTGVITFKNTNYINLIDKVPLEQLLLETDSPFPYPSAIQREKE